MTETVHVSTAKAPLHRPQRGVFVLTTSGIFTVLSLVLVLIDFVPEVPVSKAEEVALTAPEPAHGSLQEPVARTPVRVRIPAIDVDTSVVVPDSTALSVLDEALTKGAVQYPGSGELGSVGNVLIFGHSSYLPVVHNSAYRALNGVGTLAPGDLITVESDTHSFTYTVKSVRQVSATDSMVRFNSEEPILTLVTCNTFGSKDDRHVVTALFTSVSPRSDIAASNIVTKKNVIK